LDDPVAGREADELAQQQRGGRRIDQRLSARLRVDRRRLGHASVCGSIEAMGVALNPKPVNAASATR
jgi:hypothetical protein